MKIEDLNMTEKELCELESLLKNRNNKKRYEENIKKINENKKYINKCFKEKNSDKYIRVLSSKSSNEFRLECMCFKFPIEYIENHNLTKIFNSDNAFSQIDFEGIYVEDYPLLCSDWKTKNDTVLNSLIEITEDEYFEKMNEYIKSLQQMIKNGDFDTSKNNQSMFSK